MRDYFVRWEACYFFKRVGGLNTRNLSVCGIEKVRVSSVCIGMIGTPKSMVLLLTGAPRKLFQVFICLFSPVNQVEGE